jgi:hypothetical protein
LLQYEPLKLTIVGADTAAPALPDVADPKVQVWRDHEERVCAYGHTVRGVHWMHLPGLASFRFGSGVDGVMAIPQPPIREDRIVDEYRRKVLPMALQALGQEVLHASAVLTQWGVVAMCATTKIGKSTTAFGLSQRGWPLWADDTVVFEKLDGGIKAIPLPFAVRLRPDAAALFDQHLRAASADPGWNGADRMERGPAPLAALLLLNRSYDSEDAVVHTRRLLSTEAFTDVLTHAYYFRVQDAERKRRMMHQYLELVARVPVFEVRFRPGLKTLSVVLDGIGRVIDQTLDVTREPA